MWMQAIHMTYLYPDADVESRISSRVSCKLNGRVC